MCVSDWCYWCLYISHHANTWCHYWLSVISSYGFHRYFAFSTRWNLFRWMIETSCSLVLTFYISTKCYHFERSSSTVDAHIYNQTVILSEANMLLIFSTNVIDLTTVSGITMYYRQIMPELPNSLPVTSAKHLVIWQESSDILKVNSVFCDTRGK